MRPCEANRSTAKLSPACTLTRTLAIRVRCLRGSALVSSPTIPPLISWLDPVGTPSSVKRPSESVVTSASPPPTTAPATGSPLANCTTPSTVARACKTMLAVVITPSTEVSGPRVPLRLPSNENPRAV